MTWNEENRFGGGAHTEVGLKEDGEALLNWMEGQKIAIDLSHTSDPLAHEILNHLDQKGLDVPVIASHSNFRAVANELRNLTDELALEVARRGGLIGLNLVRRFLGSGGISDVVRHVEHADQLGILPRLCWGTDFFDDRLSGSDLHHLKPFYNSGFEDASCYPKILPLLSHYPQETLRRLCYQNLADFLL